ncbi:MAG: helix-turn-helix transcriptional regulator [Lachnospiraceae bacterium]|nr:helix-turn-helix transcriptional regulator [Lachnospiraceae bacterium]
MILADKIILLRKRNGWSQEDLAEQLMISRQSVSKWESGASIPDLDKIIKMSTLFNVSTDYLLKEEIEELSSEEGMAFTEREESSARVISAEEAEEFLTETRSFGKMIGLGVVLCILSPACAILLSGLTKSGWLTLTETMADGISATVLLLMIAMAVVIFILKGIHYSKYDYLEKGQIVPGYGVEGIASKRKETFSGTFAICIAIGVALCILGIVPLTFLQEAEAETVTKCVCTVFLLAMIATAVYLFIYSGIIYGSYDKLLRIGDYTNENIAFSRTMEPIAGIYWSLATALYFFWSFYTAKWQITWIVWPVAGILYAAIMGIIKVIMNARKKK